jgi:hypothetical protein
MNSTSTRVRKLTLLLLVTTAILVSFVSADIETATVFIGNSSSVVDSPNLDIGIWYFISAIGIILIVLSNRVKSQPENAFYAWLAIPFTLLSAYSSLRLQTTTVLIAHSTNVTADGIHIQIVNSVSHPEWITILMAIVFLCAFINAIYITTKSPLERTDPQNTNNNKD